MIKINLMAERRTAARRGPSLPKLEVGASAENLLYVGIIAVAVLFCGYQWWSLSRELRHKNEEVVAAKLKVEEVREGLRIIADLEAKKALIEKQVGIISELKRARTIPVNLMNRVNTSLPDFLWFHNMIEAGNSVSFDGKATTSTAPANLYNNLTDSPYFSDVILNRISKDAEGVTFSLSCMFVPEGMAPPQG
jgi:Tfp pilus assembly protein PilN